MGHRCFISFKKEDEAYKKEIQRWVDDNKVDMIDKSLDTPIDSDDEEYIMQKIRADYLSDSTVTIFLIGLRSAENFGWFEQRFIKRELQASLYNGKGNTRNGILGVVLPNMTYYLDNKHDCFYAEEDRYCVLVEWAKFKSNPNFYIEQAFQKRSEPIANKVIVYPK